MNIILRPVYNRPEMLYLSFEYEDNARNTYEISGLMTLFLVEHGAPSQVLKLVEEYPYPKQIIIRERRYGLSKNILLGMRSAFELADKYVIYIEDDVLIHKTYFRYMDVLLNMFDSSEYSVLSAFNFDDNGDVRHVYKGHHYAALAPLINKEFFSKYIDPCIGDEYFANDRTRNYFITQLDKKYKNNPLYKYKAPKHNEQAGLINRLVDIALIEEGRYVIMPEVNRQRHIGFYGKNRPGNSSVLGFTFEQRVKALRKIIEDPKKMKALGGGVYDDYLLFSDKLEKWDGTLKLVEHE